MAMVFRILASVEELPEAERGDRIVLVGATARAYLVTPDHYVSPLPFSVAVRVALSTAVCPELPHAQTAPRRARQSEPRQAVGMRQRPL